MEWTTIITSILTLVAGGGWWVSARRNKKAGDLALIDKLQAKIQEQNDNLTSLKCANITLGQNICKHAGCACRAPSRGRGFLYFEHHKNEEDFGLDYTPIEDLFATYKRTRQDFSQKPPKSLEESKREYQSTK